MFSLLGRFSQLERFSVNLGFRKRPERMSVSEKDSLVLLAKTAAQACPSLSAIVEISSFIPGCCTVAQVTRSEHGGMEVTLTTGPASLLALDSQAFLD